MLEISGKGGTNYYKGTWVFLMSIEEEEKVHRICKGENTTRCEQQEQRVLKVYVILRKDGCGVSGQNGSTGS